MPVSVKPRFAVLTVGKTHSGKTTFARELAGQLEPCVIIDQDIHAAFLNTHYRMLSPEHEPYTLKYAVTNIILERALETNLHVILCNANRSRKARLKLLRKLSASERTCVLVHFAIPDELLQERVAQTTRSTRILRTSANFQDVLTRQKLESTQPDFTPPAKTEAEHYFELKHSTDSSKIIETILRLAQ